MSNNLLDAPFSIAVELESFLVGMASDVASKNEKEYKDALLAQKAIKNLSSDIRSSYDALVPNIHILNIGRTTDILWHFLLKHPDKIFNKIAIDGDIISNPSNEQLIKILGTSVLTSNVKSNLRSKLESRISALHKSMSVDKDPILQLNDIANTVFEKLQTALSSEHGTNDIGLNEAAAVAGAEFSSGIRSIFGRSAILASNIPELSTGGNYVFLSKTFDGAKTRINEALTEVFISFILNSVNIQNSGAMLGGDNGSGYTKGKVRGKDIPSIQVGNLIHFGHTTIKNELGTYLNSPASVQAIYSAAKGASSRFTNDPLKAAKAFKQKSGQLKYSYTVDKNFTSMQVGGALLALGVTITLPWSSDINIRLGSRENSALRYVRDGNLVSIDPSSLVTALYSRIGARIPQGTSSRSYIQFLQESLVRALTGKPSIKEVSSKRKASTKQVNMLSANKLARPNAKFSSGASSASSASSTASAPRYSVRNLTTGRLQSLTSLQNLINANLAQRIKENMGEGNRRDILNLRTGRLAESANVERLSQSRAGMITAFYSYMKNPYATFSDGGKQQDPKSRDPKLLISKSIREIAASQVGNRMRAVLV